MGDIIVISVLALAVILIIASRFREKKNRKTCQGCSGNHNT